MVPVVSDRVSPAPPYSGYCHQIPSCLYGTITLYGPLSQVVHVPWYPNLTVLLPHNSRNCYGLGFSAFARHYLRNHYCFLFLRVMRCFSSPGSPHAYGVMATLHVTGFPHSDICGSIRICQSPQLFAAYHVLLRLQEPRHPPYALN